MIAWAKLYLPFVGLGTFIVAEAAAFDPKDLVSAGPIGIALIAVIVLFLRHLSGQETRITKPMSKAINRNTAVLMRLENSISGKMTYPERDILRVESGDRDTDDD